MSRRLSPRSAWSLTEARQDHPDLVGPSCPGCGLSMTVHQPEADHPTDLLATCPTCRRWVVLVETTVGVEVLAVTLPTTGATARLALQG